jgi:hypothetical protein
MFLITQPRRSLGTIKLANAVRSITLLPSTPHTKGLTRHGRSLFCLKTTEADQGRRPVPTR